MFFFFSISWFLVVFIFMVCTLLFSVGVNCSSLFSLIVFNKVFLFDSISFYLVVLVIFLGLYSQVLFVDVLTNSVRLYLVLSLVFSVFSFCINHSVIFWCVYELSMLPLLYLIFKESPYSERFLAGWYFGGYLLITSLPLILILFYLSFINNSFFFTDWVYNRDINNIIYYLLSFVFFTKVPLVPFHTWLPIVHAEATSIVSIFLSGYIMKLGLLGVYRSAYFVYDSSFISYLFICFLTSICFFIVASNELDGKRWLAFLSLSHIVIPFLAFYISDWSSINFTFFYCLGHGLSAGIVFGLLWCFYDLSNSRNWLLLKSSINGVGLSLLVIFCLLSLCSFPTTIQFFCEVNLVTQSSDNFIYLLFWFVYLFMGGLVPLVLCGHLLIRSEFFESLNNNSNYPHFYFLILLCFWCYFGFIIL
uniref:NADH-ubiquinone oxidoreductase chain 4 n=1 Tax=Taenia tianguangfui TaxID=1548223 RepID=A0A8K1V5Y9_9CEST|nr:NADH dehydrogenase subunit 4 [Taenia tianguangfui]